MISPVVLLMVVFVFARSVSGSYPRAYNVTWKSTNFKTILTWGPKPSDRYSYTVEFFAAGSNKMRNRHCIQSSSTWCDLSKSLSDLKSSYMADVLSEPPLGANPEFTDFPHTRSPPFCPYNDTDIGKPDFKLEVSEDKKMTTLYVTDPLTALFKDGRLLNIRDVFSEQLMYKVIYRKNKSTGKKEYNSKTNVIELTDLDVGESYCFNIQAYIPNRSINKQLGELSQTQCSDDNNNSLSEQYSVGVIMAAIFFLLLMIGILIAVTVVCCKNKKKTLQSGNEGVPLRDV